MPVSVHMVAMTPAKAESCRAVCIGYTLDSFVHLRIRYNRSSARTSCAAAAVVLSCASSQIGAGALLNACVRSSSEITVIVLPMPGSSHRKPPQVLKPGGWVR